MADNANALAEPVTAVEPADGRALPAKTRSKARIAWLAGYAAAGLVLFLCYLKIAGVVAVTSDGGNNALQAWDLLHGNWLLRGWELGDASYYTTELPQYALVEMVLGLGPVVVHVCAAITYTLLVLLAGLLAKGDKTGKEALVRIAIASGIMIAPQIHPGTDLLLFAPDHTGTGVPLLLTFLLLDRAPRRWWVPPAVGLMLVWGQVGDRTALTMGVLPIVVVCGVRVYRDVVQRREPVAAHWFNLALGAAALVSVGVADAIVKIISSLGGYALGPVDSQFAPAGYWPPHISLAVDGVLRLFGAAFNDSPTGFATVLSAIHLVGAALAVWAVCRVIRRFFTGDDMIAMMLTVAIVAQVGIYVVSMLPYDGLQAHEIASVLPFGAVLAGRVLAERLTKARLLPALAVVACGYLLALVCGLWASAAPAHDQALADWLVAHDLTYGIGSYPEGGSVDLASHGTVHIALPYFRPDYVSRGKLFEQNSADFNPLTHYANFVVTTQQDGTMFYLQRPWIFSDFGLPVHTYHYQVWTIYTWNKNLLDDIRP